MGICGILSNSIMATRETIKATLLACRLKSGSYTITKETFQKSGKEYNRIRPPEKQNNAEAFPAKANPDEIKKQAYSVAQTAATDIMIAIGKIGVKRGEIDMLTNSLYEWTIREGSDNYKHCSLRWNATLRIPKMISLFTTGYISQIANDPQFVIAVTKTSIELLDYSFNQLLKVTKGELSY